MSGGGSSPRNTPASYTSGVLLTLSQSLIIVPPTGPIVDIPSTSEVSMGYYHYYFGLYQGNNAYDKFVNGYMPPTD